MMTQYSSSSHVISVLWKKLEQNNPNKKVEKRKTRQFAHLKTVFFSNLRKGRLD